MDKKKAGLIVGTLILAAAVTAIVLRNKKPAVDEETKQDDPAKPPAQPAKPPGSKPKAKPPLQSHAPSNPAAPLVSVQGVKTDDVLASSQNGANQKKLYASDDSVVVYNMASAVAWKARRGELLGIVSEARPASGGYVVYFYRAGVKYWTRSAHTNVN